MFFSPSIIIAFSRLLRKPLAFLPRLLYHYLRSFYLKKRGGPLRTKIILREKLLEKLREALVAVLPILIIVLILCFSVAPISPSILLCFLIGAVLLILGMMF